MSFRAHPDTIEKRTGQTVRKVVAGNFNLLHAGLAALAG